MDNVQILAQQFTRLMHLFHHLAGQVSKIGDFSLAQYRVLMLVKHYGPMTINQLQQRLSIAQSSASGMVARLEQSGWLKREKSITDRRLTVFHLTRKAETILQKRMHNMEIVYQKLLEPLSEQEQQQLLAAFATILKLIDNKQGESK